MSQTPDPSITGKFGFNYLKKSSEDDLELSSPIILSRKSQSCKDIDSILIICQDSRLSIREDWQINMQ